MADQKRLLRLLEGRCVHCCGRITGRGRIGYLGAILVLAASFARSASCYSPAFGDDVAPTPASAAEDQFVGLQHRSAHTRRVHLISELVQHGHIVQVEEFLDWSDPDRWTQHIRIKPAPSTYIGTAERRPPQAATDGALYFVVINNERQNLLYRYLPYECTVQRLWNMHEDRPDGPRTEWHEVIDYLAKDGDGGDHVVDKLVEAVMSPNLISSPYHAVETIAFGEDGRAKVNHVFGVSALWQKASHAVPLGQTVRTVDGKRSREPSWQFKMAGDPRLVLKYYFETALLQDMELGGGGRLSNTEYDSLARVELISNGSVVQAVNVVASDFDFSDELAHSLFQLPVGFGCPENEMHERWGNFFVEPDQLNSLSEIEIVSKVYGPSAGGAVLDTDTKTLVLAQARHPVYARRHVSLTHIVEDDAKVVRDFGSMLRYSMRMGPGAGCTVAKVILEGHGSSWVSKFNKQQVFVEFDDFALHELFYTNDYEQRLLNRVRVSADEDEVVFEQELGADQVDLVRFRAAGGHFVERRVTIVRVYRQPRLAAGGVGRGHLRLARVLLLVFDADRRAKLAEVRFNIAKVEYRLGAARKAHLFDVSPCFALATESIELTASYPADGQIDHLARRGHDELVEALYAIARPVIDERDSVPERRRFAAAINFLRVPRVSVRGPSPATGDRLELHFRLLDRVSPLSAFARFGEHSFAARDDDQVLIASSAADCARRCQWAGCKTFAFSPYELMCRLSRRPLLPEDDDGDRGGHLPAANASADLYRLRRHKLGSVLFAEDARQLDLGPSAAELYAYLERDMARQVDDDGDGGDGGAARPKRSPTAEPPVLALAIIERRGDGQSGVVLKRSLEPAEVHATGAPLYAPDADDHAGRVAGAFVAAGRDKRFAWAPRPDGGQERTFRSAALLYTMRPVRAASIDRCQLACYLVDEWDAFTSTGQRCRSYSYCDGDKEEDRCALAIETGAGFDSDGAEHADEVKSLESLLADAPGCVVARRRPVAEFDEPIRLDLGAEPDRLPAAAFRYKWLTVTNETLDLGGERDEPALRDQCAEQCLDRSGRAELCKAMDFCVAPPPREITTAAHGKQRHDEQIARVECHLFTLNRTADAKQVISNASALAREAAELMRSLQNNAIAGPSRPAAGGQSTWPPLRCDRYLLAQVRDYNHIKRSQIRPDVLRAQLGHQKIDLPGSSSSSSQSPAAAAIAASRDHCVSQCSMRGLHDCAGFEYCHHTGPARTAQDGGGGGGDDEQVIITCTLLFPRRGQINATAAAAAAGEPRSKDCHLYVKAPLASLGDVARLGRADEFEFSALVIAFVAAYLLLGALVALMLKKVHGVQLGCCC